MSSRAPRLPASRRDASLDGSGVVPGERAGHHSRPLGVARRTPRPLDETDPPARAAAADPDGAVWGAGAPHARCCIGLQQKGEPQGGQQQ